VRELEGRSVRELEGRSVRELEGGSAAESASSSGVGRRTIDRVRTRLEGDGFPDRGLLGMFGGLDEANLLDEANWLDEAN
jgi:hypothetical protein